MTDVLSEKRINQLAENNTVTDWSTVDQRYKNVLSGIAPVQVKIRELEAELYAALNECPIEGITYNDGDDKVGEAYTHGTFVEIFLLLSAMWADLHVITCAMGDWYGLKAALPSTLESGIDENLDDLPFPDWVWTIARQRIMALKYIRSRQSYH